MLGERLRELRKRNGFSQAQMARKLHITQGAISQWENGLTVPAADQLVTIAQLFGTSVDGLLGAEKQDEERHNDIPQTPEARTLAAGVDRMTKEERERVLKMVKLMFEHADYFERNDDDGSPT